MPIVFNESAGTISGISVGGLPDGIVDTDMIAANAVNEAKLATNQQQGLAKAWLNMNGEPSESIRDSFNVSSFTDNGTGDFVINFDTALSNANYIVNVNCSRAGNSNTDVCNWGATHTKTTSSFGLGLWQTNSGFSSTSARSNLCEIVDVVVFGD